MAAKDELGRRGEALAAAWLEGQGLVVLARNWRCSEGELDIVATDRRVVVICEVKTRSGERFGSPFERRTETLATRVFHLADHQPPADVDDVEPGLRTQPIARQHHPDPDPPATPRPEPHLADRARP